MKMKNICFFEILWSHPFSSENDSLSYWLLICAVFIWRGWWDAATYCIRSQLDNLDPETQVCIQVWIGDDDHQSLVAIKDTYICTCGHEYQTPAMQTMQREEHPAWCLFTRRFCIGAEMWSSFKKIMLSVCY
jgi:hypothetical protein